MQSQSTEDKVRPNQSTDILKLQYEKAHEYSIETFKVYSRSITFVGLGLFLIAGALLTVEQVKSEIVELIFFALPLLINSSLAAFLFLYWEHHMSRIYLDYHQKILTENQPHVYLYHEDILGRFNQSPLIGRLKSVWLLFIVIALPAVLLYGWAIWKILTSSFWQDWWFVRPYLVIVFVLGIICLIIHVKCVREERRLKEELGLVTGEGKTN